jgi:nucleotide-binding universal stress UspA family protein
MSLHIAGHDGTDRGRDAVALATRLASLYDAEVVAVHVVPVPSVRDRFELPPREPVEGARTVHASSPAAGLHQVCADEGAGLVTIGSTHRGRIGSVLAGSAAERLLSGSPCPVAIAPAGYAADGAGIARVVVGCDGSDESQVALAVAADVARRAGARLRIVSVTEPVTPLVTPQAVDLTVLGEAIEAHAKRVLAEALDRVGAERAEGEVVSGDAGPALAAQADAPGDLLVVGSRRYGPLRSVLAGTAVHHLARHATCPVLVVPRGVETDRAGELLAGGAARV